MVSGKTVGGMELYPEGLSRDTALQLFTQGSAWFSSEQGKKGQIKVGQLADVVALSADYFTVAEEEIKGIESQVYTPPMTDPGASYLKIIVRDLDKTLAALKDERTPIITPGGNPVELSGWPGITGKIRAIFVRDPDGYPVQLMEITPAPASTAPARVCAAGSPPSPSSKCAPGRTRRA
jgi:catechol 2,3-dioxygenase-like lactoylglutathione lyase family enzyme